jgi:hypothetical protein
MNRRNFLVAVPPAIAALVAFLCLPRSKSKPKPEPGPGPEAAAVVDAHEHAWQTGPWRFRITPQGRGQHLLSFRRTLRDSMSPGYVSEMFDEEHRRLLMGPQGRILLVNEVAVILLAVQRKELAEFALMPTLRSPYVRRALPDVVTLRHEVKQDAGDEFGQSVLLVFNTLLHTEVCFATDRSVPGQDDQPIR